MRLSAPALPLPRLSMAAINPLTMLGLGGLVALSAYVHRTCMRSLGPNKVDNVVHFHPADAAAAASPGALHPPLLIVTLGWGGSTCKQLRRIVAHCTHTLGCPVLTYINSMMQYLHGDLDQVQIRALLEQIKEKTEGPVAPAGFVVLLHSNNGAFVYGSVAWSSGTGPTELAEVRAGETDTDRLAL